ncbi:MAG: 4-phytase / acid phosphatase [Verrucomicrobiota bacterium]|jgi:4-phytase/acid phosphatase
MRAPVLTTLLLLLGWSLQTIGQSPSPVAQTPAASDNEVKLVVALFRHGVRAPLLTFSKTANDYSGQLWPSINDWNVPSGKGWGDLTTRGQVLATGLGNYYAQWYRQNAWPQGFKVYLLADTDARTIDTAAALAVGFQQGGIPKPTVTPASYSPNAKVDPLFHPFKAGCGVPSPTPMAKTIAKIDKERRLLAQKYALSFKELWKVLNCTGSNCIDLKSVVDRVSACKDTCIPPEKCESPICWFGTFNTKTCAGQFPYASSASEAFLLEYANSMTVDKVGWGQVDANNVGPLLELHEAYFRLTERDPYLAIMQGSNLTREIRDLISRTAEPLQPIELGCLRVDNASQFIGLVGHDTNIAEVGKMLGLSWTFTDARVPPGEHLPADTLHLPADDALPAGALVFEVRERAGEYFVRIEYVAQSLLQMRGDPKRPIDAPFRFRVACHDADGGTLDPCEMRWKIFKQVANNALGPDNTFLSRCADGQPVCP